MSTRIWTGGVLGRVLADESEPDFIAQLGQERRGDATDADGTKQRLSVPPSSVRVMRRAYVGPGVVLEEAFIAAVSWAGDGHKSVIGPSTSALEVSPWLERSGIALGIATHRRSRFTASPAGTVIGWCLDLDEVLEVEDNDQVSGVVVVRPSKSHAPWATAHDAEVLAGKALPRVPDAPSAIAALVEGITGMAVLNQGLTDSRERSEAVQALTYFTHHGHRLEPHQLVVEALRQGWPGSSSLELGRIARDINSGKRLRSGERIRTDALERWART